MEIREISRKMTSLIWQTACTNLLWKAPSSMYVPNSIKEKASKVARAFKLVFSPLYVHTLGEMGGGCQNSTSFIARNGGTC